MDFKTLTTYGKGYMVIINCDRTKEKWEVQNLCGFQKANATTKIVFFHCHSQNYSLLIDVKVTNNVGGPNC